LIISGSDCDELQALKLEQSNINEKVNDIIESKNRKDNLKEEDIQKCEEININELENFEDIAKNETNLMVIETSKQKNILFSPEIINSKILNNDSNDNSNNSGINDTNNNPSNTNNTNDDINDIRKNIDIENSEYHQDQNKSSSSEMKDKAKLKESVTNIINEEGCTSQISPNQSINNKIRDENFEGIQKNFRINYSLFCEIGEDNNSYDYNFDDDKYSDSVITLFEPTLQIDSSDAEYIDCENIGKIRKKKKT